MLICIIYFILLKFNLTNETYSEEIMSSFPNADKISFLGILIATLYISWLPILLDIIIIWISYNFITKNKLFINEFLQGALMNIPIIVIWILMQNGDLNFTFAISLIITVIMSVIVFYLLAKNRGILKNKILDDPNF